MATHGIFRADRARCSASRIPKKERKCMMNVGDRCVLRNDLRLQNGGDWEIILPAGSAGVIENIVQDISALATASGDVMNAENELARSIESSRELIAQRVDYLSAAAVDAAFDFASSEDHGDAVIDAYVAAHLAGPEDMLVRACLREAGPLSMALKKAKETLAHTQSVDQIYRVRLDNQLVVVAHNGHWQ